MKFIWLTGVAAFLFITAPAVAAIQTVSLSVPGMSDCPSCTIIVSRAIEGVEGVQSVKARFGVEVATVVYDDEITNVGTIRSALTKHGYEPSVLKSGNLQP